MDSRRVVGVFGIVAALALAIGCGTASAASPVLEFESPSSALPFSFDAQGGEVTAALSDFDTVVHCLGSRGTGEIVGPRTVFSSYTFSGCETQGGVDGERECKSEGPTAGQIQTPVIEAELVFIDQAKKEVGMLLDPHGGIYMEFECEGENVKAFGPFLSPVGPVNQESTSFTASLSRSGATQAQTAYESLTGEKLEAIPTGERELSAGTTGVELSFAIHTFQSLTVKAITAAEVEVQQRDEEAAAKKRHDDEEAAKAAAARKHAGEEGASKRQAEEAAKREEQKHAQAKARARRRSKALKQCRKAGSKQKRVRCEQRAKKRFAVH